MRAIYCPKSFEELERAQSIDYQGEKLSHLLNVIRIKENESVLILNGKGSGINCVAKNVKKRSLSLEKVGLESRSQTNSLSVGIARLKKDAMSLCLKMAVEFGVEHIYIFDSERSNRDKGQLSQDKMNKYLEGALEQSNNFFLPRLETGLSIEELPYQDFQNVFVLHITSSQKKTQLNKGRNLLLIGPEGGFTEEEFSQLIELKQIQLLVREGPIMRAPTALAWGVGYSESFLSPKL